MITLTVLEARALLSRRQCGVCLGLSPSWDGHDKNPPCEGAVRESIRKQLENA